MARKRQSVELKDTDWESLFPGEDYTIGKTTFKIEPLGLVDISRIIKKVSTITVQLSSLKINTDDLISGGDRIVGLVELILEEAPEILSFMSGLSVQDIMELPLGEVVRLFDKCLDVNINAQDDLVKNFKGLAEKFSKFANPTAVNLPSDTQAASEE